MSKHQIAYALLNESLHIVASNSAMCHILETDQADLTDLYLPDVLMEIIGAEMLLVDLLTMPTESFVLPKVARFDENSGETRYYDLSISVAKDGESWLLVTAVDVTIQAALEQELRQQRNELQLAIKQKKEAEAALQKIRIEINMLKQKEELEQITNTDFFKDLKDKAQDMRGRHRRDRDEDTP